MIYARMINNDYRALEPDIKYEVDYRIGNNHFVIKGSPARYEVKSFEFTTSSGNVIDKKFLYRYVESKNEKKRRG